MTPDSAAPDRSRLRRLPQRGTTDRAVIDAVLAEGLVAHVGIAHEGQPFVIPMVYAPDGDRVLLHGSPASRLMRALADGVPACLTVTLLDGLVLARSAFHHSMNYRSVVVFGTARALVDEAEKTAALDRIVEHVVPGRTRDARAGSARELRGTAVVALAIEEATAKVRSGPPVDDEEDLALDAWAGVIPLALTPTDPLDAPDLRAGIARPDYVNAYRRGPR